MPAPTPAFPNVEIMLPLIVEFIITQFPPSLHNPPPMQVILPVHLLFLITELLIVIFPLLHKPRPRKLSESSPVFLLSLISQLLTVMVPWLKIPTPNTPAVEVPPPVLPLISQLLTVMVPLLQIPPPSPVSELGAFPTTNSFAVFPVIVQLLRVRMLFAPQRSPPPHVHSQLVMVTQSRVQVVCASIAIPPPKRCF